MKTNLIITYLNGSYSFRDEHKEMLKNNYERPYYACFSQLIEQQTITIYFDEYYDTLSDIYIQGLENYDYELDTENNYLTIKIDKGSNFTFPKITFENENYIVSLFTNSNDGSEYNVGDVIENIKNNLEFHINLKYKVAFIMNGGNFDAGYNKSLVAYNGSIIIDSINDYVLDEDGNYYVYVPFNSGITYSLTLPVKAQITKTNAEFVGITINGTSTNYGETLSINHATIINFAFETQLISIIINLNGADEFSYTADGYVVKEAILGVDTLEIKVDYATTLNSVINNLPTLTKFKDGKKYTSTEYLFDSSVISDGKLVANGNANVIFEENEYTVVIVNAEKGNEQYSETKKYGEIFSEPNLEIDYREFIGLSLIIDEFVEITWNGEVSLLFENETIKEYIVQNNNEYSLTLYSFYNLKANITIKGVLNSAYTEEFTGIVSSLNYEVDANGYITFSTIEIDVVNPQEMIYLVPTAFKNEMLFKAFKGYYEESDDSKTIIIDKTGKITSSFEIKNTYTLVPFFENILFDFVINADYDKITLNAGNYDEYVGVGFIKQVAFGETLLDLPVVACNSNIFKGYIISGYTINSTEITPELIAGEDGKIISKYNTLNSNYFVYEKDVYYINYDAMNSMREVSAYFEEDLIEIEVNTSNYANGRILNILSKTQEEISKTNILDENNNVIGYKVNLPRYSEIYILTEYDVEKFSVNLPNNLGIEFENINDKTIKTSQIYSNCEITIAFVPIQFNITYYDNENQLMLEPSSYNCQTETFMLPDYEKTYYTFDGWYLENSYTTKVESIEKGSYGDLALFAKTTRKTITINIDYQDKESNKYYNAQIEDEEKFTIIKDSSGLKQISFNVEMGADNVELPRLTYENDNYIVKYYVNDIEYNIGYKFEENTEITVKYEYKVNFVTNGGSFNNYYLDLTKDENDNYYLFVNYNTSLTLPTTAQVVRTNSSLVKILVNSVEREIGSDILISEPTEIVLDYDAALLTININLNGADEFIFLADGTLIKEAKFDDEKTSLEIKVYYGSSVNTIISALPTLTKTEINKKYTFIGYDFSNVINEDIFANSGNAEAVFSENSYTIKILNFETNEEQYSVTAKYGETIETPNLEVPYREFKGLSLRSTELIEFTWSSVLKALDEEFDEYVQKDNNEYMLVLYSFYDLKSHITIKGVLNSAYTEEFTNITNSTNYEEDAEGYITFSKVEFDVVNPNEKTYLVPTAFKNEMLFKTFKGYYEEDDLSKTLIIDIDGKITENFENKNTYTLVPYFEDNTYQLKIFATYSNTSTLVGYVKAENGFVSESEISLNGVLNNLPKLDLINCIFEGYYISLNTNVLLSEDDVQIANNEGQLLEGYTSLTTNYFNYLLNTYNCEVTQKQIVAKYSYDYVTIKVVSNDEELGNVLEIKTDDEQVLTNEAVSGGYEVKVIKGSNVVIEANYNTNASTFEWTSDVDGLFNETNKQLKQVKLENVTNDLTIVANFTAINFNLTYIMLGKEQNLTPNSYNVKDEFNLPVPTEYDEK